MRTIPACMIAATRSGAGKTTITLGIMAALAERGLRVQPFKCGPDFIDPTLHTQVTGSTSYNLDPKMMGPDCCRHTFAAKAAHADVAVVEGVMGLFDGGEASSASLAKLLNIPVFLIVDAQSCAESAAAVVTGFISFDPDIVIGGVIFNKIGSDRHRELIESAMIRHCDVPVLGYIRRDGEFTIAERHLGLHMGEEEPLDRRAITLLSETVESGLKIDLLLASRCPVGAEPSSTAFEVATTARLRIGVARDEAFCFYYPQNLELFAQAGFEVVEFSPLRDRTLPEGLDFLYFGGGYPENHARVLADNTWMREAVRDRFAAGTPIYGECGGFMYLCKTVTGFEGDRFDMVGIFPFDTVMAPRLRRLGYRRVTLRKSCFLGDNGSVLYGHEFHYSHIVEANRRRWRDPGIEFLYDLDNNSHEGYSVASAIGSYVHLHFSRTPDVLEHLRRYIEHGTG